MLAQILCLLPAIVTGRVESRARREVRELTRNNPTRIEYGYAPPRRILMWGAKCPVKFTLSVGFVCVFVGISVDELLRRLNFYPSVEAASKAYEIASYLGIPWAVQATLVALVYPIVLSFVALMLQRKAHSTVALGAYVWDSGVIPAGISSLGLLIFMGMEYFLAPYFLPATLQQYFLPLVCANSIWLLVDILLTGFFLSRTVRFLQEEEQRHVFTRFAIDVALTNELTLAVKQRVFLDAPQRDWGYPSFSDASEGLPIVHTYQLSLAAPVRVTCSIGGRLVLRDVHLRLIHLVVRRWYLRAMSAPWICSEAEPVITFPPKIGEAYTGQVLLCEITGGPALTPFEERILRAAFLFGSTDSGASLPASGKMIEEILSEATVLAEGRRFAMAQAHLQEAIKLHSKLLLACVTAQYGPNSSLATLEPSPYRLWGNADFNSVWWSAYRDISRIAVDLIDEDRRLFRTLTDAPNRIARTLPASPPKLLERAQQGNTEIAVHLASWWIRKADANLTPGGPSFSGVLPQPLNKVYERAMQEFVGDWGQFRVTVKPEADQSAEDTWFMLASRTKAYAAHIESSAYMFVRAISRGDETASTWLFDNFLKWRGNRRQELPTNPFDFTTQASNLTIELAGKSWTEVQAIFLNERVPAGNGFEQAKQALNLAIERYWESVRLYVALVLIKFSGSSPTQESSELRYAAMLIDRIHSHPGGTVSAMDLHSADNVLHKVLSDLFASGSAIERIDRFAERLADDDMPAPVPGWTYSWVGTPPGLRSMRREIGILLVCLVGRKNASLTRSQALIEQWWSDFGALSSAEHFLGQLRREVLQGTFANETQVITVLQAYLGADVRQRSARGRVGRACKLLLGKIAYEREITLVMFQAAPEKINAIGPLLCQAAFSLSKLPEPIRALRFSGQAESANASWNFDAPKELFLEFSDVQIDQTLLDWHANDIREHAICNAFNLVANSINATPANPPHLRDVYDAPCDDKRAFASAVARCVDELKRDGKAAVVLAGSVNLQNILSPFSLGNESWQYSLPDGIVLGCETNSPRVIRINSAPIYAFPTPNGDCYVVPEELLHTLEIGGTDIRNSLTLIGKKTNTRNLSITVEWNARFVLDQ